MDKQPVHLTPDETIDLLEIIDEAYEAVLDQAPVLALELLKWFQEIEFRLFEE